VTCVTPVPAARRRKSRDRRHRPRGRHRPVSEPAQPSDDPAGTRAGYTVPGRPDGWPDLLGRHPMSSADRARVRKAREDGLPAGALAALGPFLCYLTIDGLDRESDPRKAMLLRGRINAAARTAGERRQTTYHATESTITIGIYGPDAQQRVDQLRDALAELVARHGLTTRDSPR
jgi:hypothetical protein